LLVLSLSDDEDASAGEIETKGVKGEEVELTKDIGIEEICPSTLLELQYLAKCER
jgi:hypothetical protein